MAWLSDEARFFLFGAGTVLVVGTGFLVYAKTRPRPPTGMELCGMRWQARYEPLKSALRRNDPAAFEKLDALMNEGCADPTTALLLARRWEKHRPERARELLDIGLRRPYPRWDSPNWARLLDQRLQRASVAESLP